MKWNKKRSGIYSIKNKINNKVYIGKTKNLYYRKYQHFGELNSNKHKNTYLQKAFNKYGKDNFEFTVIEYCDSEILGKREYFWISHYNACDRTKGYNLEGLNEDGSSKKSYETIDKLKKSIKKNKEKYRRFGKDNANSKEVFQYGIDGDFIKSYDSCHIAAKSLGNESHFSAIARCARKCEKSIFGFQWRYFYVERIEKYDPMENLINSNRKNAILQRKSIIATNLSTMEITEFSSIKEAADILKLPLSCISRIARGERSVSKKLNMTFKFK